MKKSTKSNPQPANLVKCVHYTTAERARVQAKVLELYEVYGQSHAEIVEILNTKTDLKSQDGGPFRITQIGGHINRARSSRIRKDRFFMKEWDKLKKLRGETTVTSPSVESSSNQEPITKYDYKREYLNTINRVLNMLEKAESFLKEEA